MERTDRTSHSVNGDLSIKDLYFYPNNVEPVVADDRKGLPFFNLLQLLGSKFSINFIGNPCGP